MRCVSLSFLVRQFSISRLVLQDYSKEGLTAEGMTYTENFADEYGTPPI